MLAPQIQLNLTASRAKRWTFGGASLLCAGLACGRQTATGPETASPLVSAAELSNPPAIPALATPRALPSFCDGPHLERPLSPLVKAKLVKDGFVFVEGPVWSEKLGAFLFSEMDFNQKAINGPPSTIHKLVLPDSFEPFIRNSGSNGLAVDERGLIACTHDTQTVSRFDLQTRKRSVYIADIEAKHFNSPNDIVVHSAGHVYFTDPDWQLAGRPSETGVTGVYWRDPQGRVRVVDAELDKPNGITLSPDETRLYVGDFHGTIHVYPLRNDGSLGRRERFFELNVPDGMTVDCAGNLYATSHEQGKVLVVSPQGELVSTIDVAPRTTNVAFGGSGRRTLLITAGSGVYVVETETPGFPY